MSSEIVPGTHRMTDRVATSWEELDALLFEESWDSDLQRIRSRYAFRGMNRSGIGPGCGLARMGGDLAAKERHLLRNFRKYARRSFVGDDSLWNWLALAQHHGLPTRLVDWTYSPYVALHFATVSADAMEEDGEIWMLGFDAVSRTLPDHLRHLLEKEGSDVFTGEMLTSQAPSFPELARQGDAPFPLFLEPPALTDRIVNQAALFCLMSTPTSSLWEWMEGHPEGWRRVVLSAELKWPVRDRLDQINMNERVLFPGLDGLGRWLGRYYLERADGR